MACTPTWRTALKEQGKFDEAIARHDQALALRPDYAEAHYHRADLKTFRAGDPDLAALEAMAADAGRLPPGEWLYIHFALGKALDDIGRSRTRLRALAPGQCAQAPRNQIRRSGPAANFPSHRRCVRRKPAWTAFERWAIPRRRRSSSSACPVPAARSSSRFWPATHRSTPPAN